MSEKLEKSGFVHLHCHSEYSALDGGCMVKRIPARLKELGMEAMALTDHGVMQGIPAFAKTLAAEGIKPILGLEIYLTPDRFEKHAKTETYHLTLIAETTEGFNNLMKISSYAFIEGFYRKPRADYDLLERYGKGLICMTGCMAAPTMQAIFVGDISRAKAEVERMIEIFGKGNVFGEIQNVGIVEDRMPIDSELAVKLGKEELPDKPGFATLSQNEANRALADICAELGVELVATGDVHYLRAEDAKPHDAMVCLGSGQIQKQEPRKFSLLPKLYHMRSETEMREALDEWPEAIENTLKIAERCSAEITYGKDLLPKFPLPEGWTDSNEYLRHICEVGLADLLGTKNFPAEYLERLDFELETIKNMGFPDYFLIVADLFTFAHKNGIPAGPGRGSAAGSLVAWATGITQLDPLKYKLLFERFLNPDRKSMPDIDMDFGPTVNGGRERVMQYAVEKYNGLADTLTAVCQIVTFSKYQGKGGMKDACRVLQEPTDEGRSDALKLGNRLSTAFPSKPPNIPLEEGIAMSPDLQRMEANEPKAKEAIQQARWLEGMVKTYSVHAAAVIIGDHSLEEDIPLQRLGEKAPLTTQWDMGYSEAVGLLKMDFLGLRNLDIIQNTLDRIYHTRGVQLGPLAKFYREIDLEDAKTYELFARGDTVGTFQFESTGMRESLRLVKPTEFNDLVALVALYRPGPMANIPHYAARKAGKEPINYPDPRIEEVLSETQGITVYQEQSMLISRILAGFTPGQADDLRKAIGKKLKDKMEALKKPFMEGCIKNGVPKKVAEELWDDNERSADYSFNKSHAACYAFVSYMTGYLKAHYPEEYMASLLSSVMGDKDKPRLYLSEAKRMNVRVLPPDINRSLRDFKVDEREDEPGLYDVLFGMTAIKKVGDGVVAEIRAEVKRGGGFTSIYDFCRRMPHLSKIVIQQLIRAGAFDRTGDTRKSMYDASESILDAMKKEAKDAEKEFLKAIKARAEIAAGDPEQLTLSDNLNLGEVKGKKIKLTAQGKTAVEAAAKEAWKRKTALEEEEVVLFIQEALDKAAKRDSQKQAKAELEAMAGILTAEVSSIADEDSDEDTNPVEERAGELFRAGIAERQTAAATYGAQIAPLLKAEFDSMSERSGLEAAMASMEDPPLPKEEWDHIEKLNYEREALGIYVTGHPLDRDVTKWRRYVQKGLGELDGDDVGKVMRVAAAIVAQEVKITKRGSKMMILTIEDLTGSQQMTMFEDAIEGGLADLIAVGRVAVFDAKVEEDTFQSQRNQEEADAGAGDAADGDASSVAIRLICQGPPRNWDPDKIEDVIPVKITIPPALFNKEWIGKLREICEAHPGNSPVRVIVKPDPEGKPERRLGLSVASNNDFKAAVKQLFQDSKDLVAPVATDA